MKKIFAAAALAGLMAITVVGSTGSFADSTMSKMSSKKTVMPMTMKCPFCGMIMPSKKTSKMPVPVVIKGHTYYCCTSCHKAPKKSSSMKKM